MDGSLPLTKISTKSFAGSKWILREATRPEFISGCKIMPAMQLAGTEITEVERVVRDGNGEIVGILSDIECQRVAFPSRLLTKKEPSPATSSSYILTKDFLAHRFNSGGIQTEEYIAPKQFKKGDIVSGREVKHSVTGATRILVGKLDVTDAVAPYKVGSAANSASAATIKSSVNNIPTPVKALLGLAFILLVLKWQKII